MDELHVLTLPLPSYLDTAHQRHVDELRAQHKAAVDALTASLQQASSFAQRWKLLHDKLAESMHQLLLVLEARVQPEALRSGKEGREGASITGLLEPALCHR